MKILKEEEFENAIKEGIVLIDFFATWCMPCKMMAQVLERVEEQIWDKAKIYKVDVDESENLSRKFGVLSIPTIVIFNGGNQVEKRVGLMQEDEVVSALKNAGMQ